jgi:hypothetical protein
MTEPLMLNIKIEYQCTAGPTEQARCKHYEKHPAHDRCMFRQSFACCAPWAQREAFGALVTRKMEGEVMG